MTKGKFIVIYGVNNLGKTTQAQLLVDRLQKEGHKTIHWKYPILDMVPTGKLLNDYVRQGNPYQLTPREFQFLQVINRLQAQEVLLKLLDSGTCVVAEDYRGTGMAWGIGTGVEEELMRELNHVLYPEDLSFLFYGKRFLEAREQNHQHETNDDLVDRVAKIHDQLGEEFGWTRIYANDSREVIHEKIWAEVVKILPKR